MKILLLMQWYSSFIRYKNKNFIYWRNNMKIHHKIIHHVRKHKERVVAHIQKHHKKYIFGAWIVSWMAVFKLVGVLAIFFGASYMGWWTLGWDYYDAEYYLQQASKDISISNIMTWSQLTTWCSITGLNLSWTTGNCPVITK